MACEFRVRPRENFLAGVCVSWPVWMIAHPRKCPLLDDPEGGFFANSAYFEEFAVESRVGIRAISQIRISSFVIIN